MTKSFQEIQVLHDAEMRSNEVSIEFHAGDPAPRPRSAGLPRVDDIPLPTHAPANPPVQPNNDVPPPPSSPHVVVHVGRMNDVPPPPSTHVVQRSPMPADVRGEIPS
jgi:hypothetical protein